MGWHFFKEGAEKASTGSFSSAGFLSNAKGPLAGLYHGRVWDSDGRIRLNYALDKHDQPTFNLDPTLSAWEQFRARAAGHYQLDKDQIKRSEAVLRSYEGQLKWYYGVHGEDIEKYFRQLQRREGQLKETDLTSVESLKGQGDKLQKELVTSRRPWLGDLDRLWASYEREVNAVAKPEQIQSAGLLRISRPGQAAFDTRFFDAVIPYFDLIIGVLLVLGLFTRTAALAGALFLGSVIVSQWPGAEGSMPTYYQSVELLALVALAATGAGRYAGLDFFVHALRVRFWPPKQETN